MGIQSSYFTVNGSTKTFPSTKHIATKQHMAVWLQLLSDDSFVQLAVSDYELINNTAVLTNPPSPTTYTQLELRVADEPDELGQSQSDLAVVAAIADEIIIVAGIEAEVITVAGDSAVINTTAGDTLVINIVAGDTLAVNIVANDTVALNLVGTDLAKGIGTNQPTDSAILNALTNAIETQDNVVLTNADVVLTHADVVITNGDVVLTNADVVLTHDDVALTNADVVLTNADVVSAGASATESQLEAWNAEAEKMTADSYATEAEDVFVKLYTSDGDGTFSFTNSTEYSALHWAAKSEQSTEATPSDVITNGSQTSGALSLPTTEVTGSIPILYTGNGTSQDVATPMQIANDNGDGVTKATGWVSGIVDAQIDDVYIDNSSTGDELAYRCIIAVLNGTVSPRLDTTNWVLELNQYGGRFWFKNRDGTTSNLLIDTIRRESKGLISNLTDTEGDYPTGVTSINTNSVSLGAQASFNTNLDDYVLWVDQTTRKTAGYRTDAGVMQNSKNNTGTDLMATDSAGNPIIEHYNPTAGFSIIMDTGNGVAGRSIPDSLQSLKGTIVRKLLTTTARNWYTYDKIGGATKVMLLNSTTASTIDATQWNDTEPTEDNFTVGSSLNANTAGEQYITYLQADSANHYIGSYHGTGAVGNVVDIGLDMTVAGSYVMIKRLDAVGSWVIVDNVRGVGLGALTKFVYADTSGAEITHVDIEIEFTTTGVAIGIASSYFNASGGLYLIQAYSPNYAQPTGGSDVNVNADIDLTYTQGIGLTNLQETTSAHTVELSAFAGDKAYILKERGSDAIGFATGLSVAQERGDIVGYYLNTLDKKVYDSVDAATSIVALGECKVDGQGNAFGLVEYEPLVSYFNDTIIVGNTELRSSVNMINLPTANPFIIGEIWSDSGTLTVSEGA